MLLGPWLLEKSAAASSKPLTPTDLEWLTVHCWNLAKRTEQLGLGKHTSLLHRAVGVLVLAMPEPSMDHLRRAHASLVGASGHALVLATSVRYHCLSFHSSAHAK
jgi:hypothetical protein